MKKILFALILSVLFIPLVVHPANAYFARVLATSAGEPRDVQIGDGIVAYRLFATNTTSGPYQVFAYNIATGTTTQLSNDPIQTSVIRVAGGMVVFGTSTDSNPDVYDSASGVTAELPNNNALYGITSGDVVSSNGTAIDLYNVVSATTTQVPNSVGAENIQVKDGYIIWNQNNQPISLYKISDGTTIQLPSSVTTDIPQLGAGGNIYWHDSGELNVYNIASATLTQRSISNYPGNAPLNEGYSVWASGGQIYLYDSTTDSTTQITNTDFTNEAPQINNGKIVWIGDSGDIVVNFSISYREVYTYDIASGTTTRITNNSMEDNPSNPDDQGDILWFSQFGGSVPSDGLEMYFVSNGTPVPQTVSFHFHGGNINPGDTYTETATVTDTNPDAQRWVARIQYGDGSFERIHYVGSSKLFTLSHKYDSPGIYTITISLNSDHDASDVETTTVTVGEPPVAPVVGNVTASPNPVKQNVSTSITAGFTDANTADTHTATIDWGDGHSDQCPTNCTLTESNGSGTVTGSHTYTALGSYTAQVTVTDNTNLTGLSEQVVSVIPTNGLAGGNLSHTDYSGADLSNQNISKANLSVGTFNNVDFASANLSQVNGSNSSFTNDNFTGANLTKINFSNSNLSGSNFTNAILTQANFHGATITGVTWANTTCPNVTNSDNDGGTCVGQGGGL